MRTYTLFAFTALFAAAVVVQTCGAAEPVYIVKAGTPRAAVVVPTDCDAQIRAAADLLVQYVRESSGAELPLGSEDKPSRGGFPVTIHVGLDQYGKGLDLSLSELDGDGFVILAADQENLVITGPTPYGTEFGVCEFLERYVGVRWLMPGPDGADVPRSESIKVPLGELRHEPAFSSRLFSGLSGPQVTWARRNRMHGRVQFHHNLQRLIAPEKYAESHPEFFPIRNGERYLPANSDTHGWQPCFSAPGLAEEAAKTICAYFKEHPEAESYSLGVVDSSGHCQCEKCQAAKTRRKRTFWGVGIAPIATTAGATRLSNVC